MTRDAAISASGERVVALQEGDMTGRGDRHRLSIVPERWLVALLVALSLTIVGIAPVFALSAPEQRILQLVNDERSKHGLAPLTLSDELTNSARAYAQALGEGNFFSHDGLDGSTFVSRNEAAGYRGWVYMAENLAAGQTSPEQAMTDWLASPGHQQNILSANAREIGIAYVYVPGSTYGHYWVQEFGDRGEVATLAVHTAELPTAQASSWIAPNNNVVTEPWLSYVRNNGDVDVFGLPLTNAVSEPGGGGLMVQYFQRAVLEWHPDNPADQQIQRRLLGDILYQETDPPVSSSDAPPGPSTYFPFSPDRPTGLGHFVADYTRTGEFIGFKQYFDAHGGVATFGYPKEEPKLRDGRWTQRFQAAVFAYHPENDRDGFVPGTNTPWRHYRVQLELLGEQYLNRNGAPSR